MAAAAADPYDDGMDLQIGEASRAVRVPPVSPQPPRAQGVPAMGRGTGAVPSAPTNGARPDMSGAMAAAGFGASVAPVRRRSRTVLWIMAGTVTAGLAAVFLIIAATSGARESDSNEPRRSGSKFADNYYKGQEGRTATPPPEPAPAPVPAPVVEAAKPKPVAPRPKPVASPTSTTAVTPPAPPPPTGKVDTFAEETSGSGSLSVDDIRNAYRANEVVIKRCYERALKQDPGLGVTKMIVTLTVAPSGIVDRVSVPQGSSALGACVTQAIRSWRFRKTAGEFTAEFPILFAKPG